MINCYLVNAAAPPNWELFYRALIRLGPTALKGIPKEWVKWFQEEGAAGDWFWSEYIYESLETYWEESPELAVCQAMVHYVEAVQAGLSELPFGGFCGSWLTDPVSAEPMSSSDCIAQIRCDDVPPRILRALVGAAKQPSSEEVCAS